jgi:peptide deformylase
MNPYEDAIMPMLMNMAGKADEREEELRRIEEYGLDRILEQQTPKTLQTEIRPEAIEIMDWVRRFVLRNKYEVLAGVAANQLFLQGGRITIRACVVRVAGGKAGDLITAFNPKIIEKRAPSFQAEEGCLTWPGKRIHAMRYSGVTVEYENLRGEICTHKAEGFEAQVWQHEINHLDGVAEDVRAPVRPQGPNEPCQCSSGKKFKRCCGRNL